MKQLKQLQREPRKNSEDFLPTRLHTLAQLVEHRISITEVIEGLNPVEVSDFFWVFFAIVLL